MDRILQNTQSDIKITLYQDGVATDATGTPTVSITREDGSALTSGNAVKVAATTGIYKFTLTPTHTAALDVLKATWSASLGGANQQFVTYAEIVGGFLFSVADARALKPLDSTSAYPTEHIITARSMAEQALEDACGVAFVPRYRREVLDGSGADDLFLSAHQVRRIRSASIDGTALTVGDLDLYEIGKLYRSGRWTTGRRNVEVIYEHGYLAPPPRVSRAAVRLAKRFLVDSPVNDRATSLVNDDGTTQFFVTAGVRDAVFDLPEANAVVAEYSQKAGVG